MLINGCYLYVSVICILNTYMPPEKPLESEAVTVSYWVVSKMFITLLLSDRVSTKISKVSLNVSTKSKKSERKSSSAALLQFQEKMSQYIKNKEKIG